MRFVCIAVWVGVIVGCLSLYLVYPQTFTPENIASFLGQFQGEIWLVYLVLSALRGISLLPSTPLVIAGTMLFPAQPIAVLGVSIAGIVISSTMIYHFSEYLGFSDFFEGRNPKLMHRIKTKLEHPLGFLFVAAWAFFPLVPTDLVCYVAGTTKMNYWKFIFAIVAGEITLCSIYIFFGGAVLNYVR